MISKLLKKNEKGFTLMEMLIVVTIIAVLIAIAIPTFNASLNKARVATDEANIRSGYATVMATVLTEELGEEPTAADAKVTYWLKDDGSVAEGETKPTSGAYACKGTVGASDAEVSVGGVKVGTTGKWSKGADVSYTYTYATNTIVINVPGTVTGG